MPFAVPSLKPAGRGRKAVLVPPSPIETHDGVGVGKEERNFEYSGTPGDTTSVVLCPVLDSAVQ